MQSPEIGAWDSRTQRQKGDNEAADMYLQKRIEENLMRKGIHRQHIGSGDSFKNRTTYRSHRDDHSDQKQLLHKIESEQEAE